MRVFAKEPKKTMDDLGKLYELKPESVHEPDIYLGANMERFKCQITKLEWSMGSKTYVKNAIRVVEALITEDNPKTKLKSTARNPFPSGYKPKMGVTPELNNELGLLLFLQLIGITRWPIELGRLDNFVEVSQLSQHQALPRCGHLEAFYHIFAYLKKHESGARIVLDPKAHGIDDRVLNLTPIVGETCTGTYARNYHRICQNQKNAPIIWFLKQHNAVKSSSFGSDFVALRAAKDVLVASQFKLRMLGAPIDGPASVFCDNHGVVKNMMIPESMLAKKHNAINYHGVREAVAAKIIRLGKEVGMTNLADLLTKVLTAYRC